MWLTKVLIAGALGAGLLAVTAQLTLYGCQSCSMSTTSYMLAGFVVGAGVQGGVMILGVS